MHTVDNITTAFAKKTEKIFTHRTSAGYITVCAHPTQAGIHTQLAVRCSALLVCVGRLALMQGLFLALLLSWDLYKCPPLLVVPYLRN